MFAALPVNFTFRKYGKVLAAFVLLIVSGCAGTKRVPADDALFTGFNVQVDGKNDSSNRQKLMETELSATVRPKPNFSILGMRPKLAIYNTFYTEKEKGLKHWIQTKLGEPPVLISAVDTGNVNEIMSSRLHNRGYFNNAVQSKTNIKVKKATIDWRAFVSEPYRIRKIEYTLADSLPVHQDIQATEAGSLVIPGEPYDLEKMTGERVRIDANLKNKGYYYFSPDMLIFSVDTTVGNRQADVLMRLKKDVPSPSLRPYKIDDIYIFANYNLGDSLSVSDTIDYKGFHYIPNENYVRARHLLRGVFLEQDSLYSRQDHLLTINRLAGLPAYKYVNIDYKPDTTQTGKLDSFIYLTPAFKKTLRMEGRYVSKSNNFAGPGITISFRNRNALKGSELLSVDFIGNFESQVGGRGSGTPPEGQQDLNKNLSSYELGVQTSLTIPRIVSPFELRNLRTEFVPKTRIGLGFNFLNRVQYFQMNSFNASYSYNWRPKKEFTHDVTPINLQYVQLANTTIAFDTLLAQNQFLRRSFEDQFIIGSIYQFTFTNQLETNRTHQFFDNFTLDGSGNLINGLQSLTGAEDPEEDMPRTIFGKPYSQYVRAENDFRYYFNFGNESQIATRFLAGIGYAHGNSTVLPYVKQFSIGGPNSIRAFRARSIGPGTYDAPDSLTFSYFDQTGDMKLEANIEYRFPLAGFFKGAVFVDAGNIWLLNETLKPNGEPDKPGGLFKGNEFMSQLAVGTGFGLRIDVDFFVMRFDVGIPVRSPNMPDGEQNVLSDLKFGFKGDNSLTLNIAIGYPF
ncbi:BamA/TamA family outer membrane protein [Pontibacter sp. BT310]|uniref:BamA/TamA family outer membrane protein n=1 Tax=Pontibacter populi TaxID=890055 RepID=A0ABS6X624_9BACT|nr:MULTISPECIES: BamA/TamA family outer membrane protein [Pontibacter]MBJ6116590.1 BamA/TamA family outer membrane protein [Pontibacter sp. BT310]MBR0569014.1 BamA/TamA family outer membrane protein [Microvirga sp. STS03]MBW3363443.1 BamA/TamA family outer membrane protein [Pontibacter populi]